jgi:hypothetical protein
MDEEAAALLDFAKLDTEFLHVGGALTTDQTRVIQIYKNNGWEDDAADMLWFREQYMRRRTQRFARRTIRSMSNLHRTFSRTTPKSPLR